MNLYLFGGLNDWQLASDLLNKISPKEILFVGFAGNEFSQKENFIIFKTKLRKYNFRGKCYNANDRVDVQRTKHPLIFVTGGDDHIRLLERTRNDKRLNYLITRCEYYIGDSAGSMLIGSKQRQYGDASPLMDGLGILKNTLIEPHYSQWNRHQQLINEMKQGNVKTGIGIDEDTGIIINIEKFPDKWIKIGQGVVKVINLRNS